MQSAMILQNHTPAAYFYAIIKEKRVGIGYGY